MDKIENDKSEIELIKKEFSKFKKSINKKRDKFNKDIIKRIDSIEDLIILKLRKRFNLVSKQHRNAFSSMEELEDRISDLKKNMQMLHQDMHETHKDNIKLKTKNYLKDEHIHRLLAELYPSKITDRLQE